MRTPASRSLVIVWLCAGALVIASGVALAIRFLRPAALHGTYLDPPKPPAPFTLHTSDGPLSLSDLRGKVVALYFGYTFCPDHCPLTFARLAQAVRSLGRTAGDVRVVMVSVDPERDSPEQVAAYVRRFSPGFIGLSGTLAEIDAVAKSYGVFYEKKQVDSAAGYLIDHTVSILVLDRSGALTLIWPPDIEPGQIVSDLRKLLRMRG